jgi:hypothetical protein
MDGQGIVVRFPTGVRGFLFPPQLENRLYGQPDVCTVCTGGLFPGDKAAGSES